MPAPRKHPDPEPGTVFGYGTVVALASFKRSPSRRNWERGAVLLCACGTEYLADLSALYSGDRKSCGCRRKNRGIVATPGYAQHPLYFTWHGMIDRCYNSDVINYYLYGARGIRIYEGWRGLEGMANFVNYIERELGPRPPHSTLDRIDSNGNYVPGNLRWATPVEQTANTRTAGIDRRAVRVWALEQGLPVQKKGAVPLWIVELYKARLKVQRCTFYVVPVHRLVVERLRRAGTRFGASPDLSLLPGARDAASFMTWSVSSNSRSAGTLRRSAYAGASSATLATASSTVAA